MTGQTSAPSLGLVPIEASLVAGVLYLVLALIAVRLPDGETILGFGRHLRRPGLQRLEQPEDRR